MTRTILFLGIRRGLLIHRTSRKLKSQFNDMDRYTLIDVFNTVFIVYLVDYKI